MICAEIISIIKDIILSFAAIIGTLVAVKGLSTWRRQLTGQSEYELARRILVNLFKYRDAINGVRYPVISEFPSPPEEESKNMNLIQRQFYGTFKVYQTRWDKVREQKASLYVELLEAEALWGKELNNLFKVISDLEHELFVRVLFYIKEINPDTSDATKENILKAYKNRPDILYEHLPDIPDEYKKNLLNAIAAIEDYLKPKLKHERI